MFDPFADLHLLLRWAHVLSGVVWVGHLFVFTFVVPPTLARLAPASRRELLVHLLPRALFFMRWSAMLTLLFGVALFTLVYLYTPEVGFGENGNLVDHGKLTGRAMWILLGIANGVVMWWNVWMAIWPAQYETLRALAAHRDPDPALAKLVRRRLAVNMGLAAPLLFTMLAPSHYIGFSWRAAAVVTLIAWTTVAAFYWLSPRIGALSPCDP